MERRAYIVSSQGGNSSTMTGSQYRVTNSFIPTTNSHHGHQHTSAPNIQMHQHKQIPSYYGTTGANSGTTGISRIASASVVVDPAYNNYHPQQQQIQRTLTKSYSTSHHHHQQQQQSHYGLTGHHGGANGTNNPANHNHQGYYGNMTSSSQLMNGHVHSNHHQILSYKNSNGDVTNSRGPGPVPHQSQVPVHHHNQQQQQYSVPRQEQPPPPPPPQQMYVQHNQGQIPIVFQAPQAPQQQQQLPQQLTNGHHYTNGNLGQYLSPETEGLPSTLVESMRTLFDILDDSKQGKIRLSDIESRWEIDSNGQPTNGKGSGAEPLIKMGVLGYLRKVTPSDGMLTFDRFCAGLRLALLTNGDNDEGGFLPMPTSYAHFQTAAIIQQSQQVSTPPEQQIGLPTIPPPPQEHQFQKQQQTFQQQVRSLVNKSSLPVVQNASTPPSNNNTMNRSSKIPSLSSSRLPMPNSGSGTNSSIPTTPNSRIAFSPQQQRGTPQGTSGSSSNNTSAENSPGSNNPPPPNNSTYPTKSALKNSISSPLTEQAVTIALVHQQPPPNPKPSSGIPSGTLKMTKQTSAPGLQRYQQKNSSLDDLNSSGGFVSVAANHNHSGQHNHGHSHHNRPPSAPLLDTETDENRLDNHHNPQQQNGSHLHQRQSQQETYSTGRNGKFHHNRERAKSQDREREHSNNKEESNNNGNGGGNKKVSIVTPRHRTLSMPQLQLNKLIKSKSSTAVVNFEDNQNKNGGGTEGPTQNGHHHHNHQGSRIGTLKGSSNSTSKLGGGGGKSVSSSLLKYAHNNNSNKNENNTSIVTVNGNDHQHTIIIKGEKELPPPPPKPPRNGSGGVNGPVTISTTLITNAVIHQEPPLSGSSQGSGQTQTTASTMTLSSGSTGGGGKLSEIRNALQSWQKGILSTDKKPVEQTLSTTSVTTNSSINTNATTKSAPAPVPPAPPNNNVEAASGNENVIVAVNNARNAAAPQTNQQSSGTEVKLRAGGSKTNMKRRETPRRHTVQTGIDFATLKRLKQLEQERDVLQQGMTYLEKAQQWYVKQLETADDRIALLSKGAPITDFWSESHEESLNLLGCRVSEVNSLLSSLMDGSSQLPVHMNLQIPSHLSLRTMTRLKDQNRQLTQEVSDCSHRITQLETEKAMLLRQLFHQKNSSQSDETVYM